MPMHEYQCTKCGYIQEVIIQSALKAGKVAYIKCKVCGSAAKKIISLGQFFVHGYNAKNGYNLPLASDVLNRDGTSKKVWGRNK